jgi:hypothetical protein
MMDDLSDINFQDPAIQAFFEALGGRIHLRKPEELTLSALKEHASYTCTRPNKTSFLSHGKSIETLVNLSSSNRSMAHLDQLLKYIGGNRFSESYISAKESAWVDSTEYKTSSPKFSLGVSYKYRENSKPFINKDVKLDYAIHSIEQLFREARLILNGQLFEIYDLDYDQDDDDNYYDCKCNYISLFMNNVEAMRFHINLSGCELIFADIDLCAALPTAEIMSKNKAFTDLLFKGVLFNEKAFPGMNQRMKGRLLENELGI